MFHFPFNASFPEAQTSGSSMLRFVQQTTANECLYKNMEKLNTTYHNYHAKLRQHKGIKLNKSTTFSSITVIKFGKMNFSMHTSKIEIKYQLHVVMNLLMNQNKTKQFKEKKYFPRSNKCGKTRQQGKPRAVLVFPQ